MLKKQLLILSVLISLTAPLAAQTVETGSPNIIATVEQYTPDENRKILLGEEMAKLNFTMPRTDDRMRHIAEMFQVLKVSVKNNSNKTIFLERNKYLSTVYNSVVDLKKIDQFYPRMNSHVNWRRVVNISLFFLTLCGLGIAGFGVYEKDVEMTSFGLGVAAAFGLLAYFTNKSVSNAKNLRSKLQRIMNLLPRVNGAQVKSELLTLAPGDTFTDKLIVDVASLKIGAALSGGATPELLTIDGDKDYDDEYDDEDYDDEV